MSVLTIQQAADLARKWGVPENMVSSVVSTMLAEARGPNVGGQPTIDTTAVANNPFSGYQTKGAFQIDESNTLPGGMCEGVNPFDINQSFACARALSNNWTVAGFKQNWATWQVPQGHNSYLDFLPTVEKAIGGITSDIIRFIMPVQGTITQGFGPADPGVASLEPEGIHQGIDIGATEGTPVQAPASGRVIASGWDSGLGNRLVVDVGNGVQYILGHLESPSPLQVGQTVNQGDFIGNVGSTGVSTGPHLHYQINQNGQPVDPLNFPGIPNPLPIIGGAAGAAGKAIAGAAGAAGKAASSVLPSGSDFVSGALKALGITDLAKNVDNFFKRMAAGVLAIAIISFGVYVIFHEPINETVVELGKDAVKGAGVAAGGAAAAAAV